jgi:hypothetical protein
MIEDLVKTAQALAGSKFLPESFREDVPTITHLLMTGQEMGFQPAFALRALYPTREGGVGIVAQAALALLYQKGFGVKIVHSDDHKAVVRVWRPGESEAEAYESEWTQEKASRISIWRDGGWHPLTTKYNWKAYPKDMLFWRALMEAARRKAPDLLAGIYTPDELEGLPGNGHSEPQVVFRRQKATEQPQQVEQQQPEPEPEPEPEPHPEEQARTEQEQPEEPDDIAAMSDEEVEFKLKQTYNHLLKYYTKDAIAKYVASKALGDPTAVKGLKTLPHRDWLRALRSLHLAQEE